MSNHFYTVGGNLYRQADGSPMGLDTSVEASDIYMLIWEKAFLDKLTRLGWLMLLYKRYVDDICTLTLALNKGWYYDRIQDKMMYDKDHANINMKDDKRTFMELLAIGNSLDINIQLEIDVPSLHIDYKLPILDLKVWIEDQKIRHIHYRKEVASNMLIMNRSALPTSTKRDTLFQEGIRILRNCDPETHPDIIKDFFSDFSNRMRLSGYNVQTRIDIIKGVLARSRSMEEQIRQGKVLRYRNRTEIEEMKQQSKGRFQSTWYLRGEYTGVMKVQPTPNSGLAAEVRRNIQGLRGPDGGLTKVIEASGTGILLGLNKADPYRSYNCPFNDSCWSAPKADCWKSKTVYRITCLLCGSQYTGTSGTSLHKRTKDHMDALRRGDKSNAMAKHFLGQHPDTNRDLNTQLFKVEVIEARKSDLERYIAEGIHIEDAVKEDRIPQLNSKGEWGRVSTKRITVVDRLDS